MTEALARYNDIQQAEASEIEDALREQVEQMGTVAEYGWIATMKPGRKSTDHEAAVKAAFDEYIEHGYHSLGDTLRELQERHTTTKVTVAWAQVTKAAKLDVEPYTTQAPPVFVLEREK